MSKSDLGFDIEDIKEAEDAYDYSDLEDLSLIEPKRKKKTEPPKKKKFFDYDEDDEEDEEEKNEEKNNEEKNYEERNVENDDNDDNDGDDIEDSLGKKAQAAMKILGIFTGVLVLAVIVGIIIMFLMNNLSKNTYEYQYNQGVEAYTNGDYELAIEYFEKALTYEETENVNERIFLYKSYDYLGQTDKAIQFLADLLQYDPDNTDAITVVAQYYFNNGYKEKLDELINKYTGTENEAALAQYMLTAPTVSYDSGSYDSSIDVVLYSSTGDSIFYTLDGSTPNINSTQYTGPVRILNGTTTLKAVAINTAGVTSAVAEREYTVTYVIPNTPEVSPASGSYKEDQKIEITNIVEGVTAYYTLDGSVPTLESEKYTQPIDMPGGNNIFSVAFISDDGVSGAVVKRNYNLKTEENYTFDKSVDAIKYILIKKNELTAEGTTPDGDEVKFVYYAKREVNGADMYLMYYDIRLDEGFVRQNYLWGVDIEKGTTYKVTESDGKFSAEEYK